MVYCPKCGRIAESVLCCDLITCGRIDDLGKLLNGCGQRFSLTEARPYVSKLILDNQDLLVEKLDLLKNVKAVHYPFKCERCKNDIIGARFECIMCECINFCESCEKDGTMKHDSSHVFRINFKGNKNLPSYIEAFLNRCSLQ